MANVVNSLRQDAGIPEFVADVVDDADAVSDSGNGNISSDQKKQEQQPLLSRYNKNNKTTDRSVACEQNRKGGERVLLV